MPTRFVFILAVLFGTSMAYGGGITVLTPTAGSVVYKSIPYTINWRIDTLHEPDDLGRFFLYRGTDMVSYISRGASLSATTQFWADAGLDTSVLYRVRIELLDHPDIFGVSGEFRVRDSTGINVVTPSAGDSFSIRLTSIEISFDYFGNTGGDHFKIALYSGENVERVIDDDFLGTGKKYTWALPPALDTSKNYRIGISCMARPAVVGYSGVFRMHSHWNVRVTSPKAGDTVTTATTPTIRWSNQYPGGYVDLDLYRNGQFAAALGSALSADVQQFYWREIPRTFPTDSTYALKLTDTSNRANNSFGDRFTLFNDSKITITQPAGAVECGKECVVAWNSVGKEDTVRISCSMDNGATWTPVKLVERYNGLTWTMPVVPQTTPILLRAMSSNLLMAGDTISTFAGIRPALIAPVKSTVTTYRPEFIWHATMPGETYTLLLCKSSTLKPPVDTFTVKDTVYTPKTDLVPGAYAWRVVPSHTPELWSDTGTFTVHNLQIPLPIGIVPDPTTQRRPIFRWHTTAGATGYHLVVATEEQFLSPLLATLLTDTTYTPTVDYPIGRIYWKVRSNLLDQYCSTEMFVIQSDSIPLLKTFKGAIITSNRPEFTWYTAKGAVTYALEIVDSASNAVVRTTTADTVFVPAVGFAPGRYAWRVSSSVNVTRFSIWDTLRIALPVSAAAVQISVPHLFTIAKATKELPLMVDYSLACPTPVAFSLFTVRGECVAEHHAQCAPGKYRWTPLQRLASRMYLLKMRFGADEYVKRIVVVP